MLSAELEGMAQAVKAEMATIAPDDVTALAFFESLAANLISGADQARAIEAQVASGSPLPNNVVALSAARKAVS